jgi:hypothetical protein
MKSARAQASQDRRPLRRRKRGDPTYSEDSLLRHLQQADARELEHGVRPLRYRYPDEYAAMAGVDHPRSVRDRHDYFKAHSTLTRDWIKCLTPAILRNPVPR